MQSWNFWNNSEKNSCVCKRVLKKRCLCYNNGPGGCHRRFTARGLWVRFPGPGVFLCRACVSPLCRSGFPPQAVQLLPTKVCLAWRLRGVFKNASSCENYWLFKCFWIVMIIFCSSALIICTLIELLTAADILVLGWFEWNKPSCGVMIFYFFIGSNSFLLLSVSKSIPFFGHEFVSNSNQLRVGWCLWFHPRRTLWIFNGMMMKHVPLFHEY